MWIIALKPCEYFENPQKNFEIECFETLLRARPTYHTFLDPFERDVVYGRSLTAVVVVGCLTGKLLKHTANFNNSNEYRPKTYCLKESFPKMKYALTCILSQINKHGRLRFKARILSVSASGWKFIGQSMSSLFRLRKAFNRKRACLKETLRLGWIVLRENFKVCFQK